MAFVLLIADSLSQGSGSEVTTASRPYVLKGWYHGDKTKNRMIL